MIDPDSVASDADLAAELGSQDALDNLMRDPESDPTPAKNARAQALKDILDDLRNRTPPVLESELSVVSELAPTVVYGAIARLYRNNITTGDNEDVSANKYKIYQKQYESRLAALRPTVFATQSAAGGSIQFSRR